MKKIVLAALVAALGMGAAMAQGTISYGPKVGVDLVNQWGEDVNHGMKFAYQVGAFLEYKFDNSRFAVAPEVVFAAQGAKFKFDGGEVKRDINTNYVNVPIMGKFYVIPDFSIDFGPQIGINVYSKLTDEIDGEKETIDIKDDTKSIDFGLGLGCSYNLSPNAFVQARYTLGLTKTFEGIGENAKNSNIQVAFGYRF